MDRQRFDDLTKALGATTSRRTVLKLLLGSAASGALALLRGPRLDASVHESTAHTPDAYVDNDPHPRAAVPANDAFGRTWARTDKPVADLVVKRTWMWGPEPFTEAMQEEYADAPGGRRTVQYFDKSRMEDNAYRGSEPWDVTNGLLVVEMITGQVQLGDTSSEQHGSAAINVAGDPDDPDGPTYATFRALLNVTVVGETPVIFQTVDREGNVTEDPSFAAYGIGAFSYVEETDHWIAAPFWGFMVSEGLVWEEGELISDYLFENPFYGTGYPITEPYWTKVRVGGVQQDVLLQCFERRCLTYTPGNPEGWQVEAGNVGRHYHAWRYGADICPVASACGTRQYCSDDQTCICIRSAEGDIRCGEIPSTCDVPQCQTSADCAHLGDGYFCDTPNSGCCSPADVQRCIAPCAPVSPPSESCTMPSSTDNCVKIGGGIWPFYYEGWFCPSLGCESGYCAGTALGLSGRCGATVDEIRYIVSSGEGAVLEGELP